MPQSRALSRTCAGRTNRSLATPRRSDGCYQLDDHRAADTMAATTVLADTAAHVHPALSGTLLHADVAGASARLPRASVAPARTFPTRQPFSAAPPAPPQRARPIEGTAPARVPAHVRSARAAAAAAVPDGSRTVRFQLDSEQNDAEDATPAGAHAIAAAADTDRKTTDATPSAFLESALSAASGGASSRTPVGFFPGSTANFGEGAGVAGTRGQRWVPQQGALLTNFLQSLHASGNSATSGASSARSSSGAGSALSPAELHSNSLMSPAHFQAKVDLVFNNIRPESPDSRVHLPRDNRTRSASTHRSHAQRQHERDLAAVRGAIQKLGAAAGDLNLRTWFRGSDTARGHAALTVDSFLRVLPELDIHLTRAQEQLLTSLTFGESRRADFLTLMPRVQADADFHETEVTPFLNYWHHLPPPDDKQDPTPTAMRALQQMKEHIEARGINAFLHTMGYTPRAPLPRRDFAEGVRRLNIRLPPAEMTRLLHALDPTGTDTVDYRQFFNLADLPANQLQTHHRVYRQVEQEMSHAAVSAATAAARSSRDEEKEGSTFTGYGAAAAPVVPSIFERVPTLQTVWSDPESAAAGGGGGPPVSRRSSAPTSASEAHRRSMIPPLFQSVHSARTAPIPSLAEVAASSQATQSARAGCAYSIENPRVPPTRFSRTHYPQHTPVSQSGGIGRPISAGTARLVDDRRAALQLPPVPTVPLSGLPLHRVAARASQESALGSDQRGSYFASESERFTPRDQAIREMQESDKQRRASRLSSRGAALDASEQRVLMSYESAELHSQRRAAISAVDRVQQKRAYMASLQQNSVTHEVGKRLVRPTNEEGQQQQQQQQAHTTPADAHTETSASASAAATAED